MRIFSYYYMAHKIIYGGAINGYSRNEKPYKGLSWKRTGG